MPLIVPDTEQVTVRGDSGDGPYANVFHIEVNGTTDQQERASAILESYITNLLPVLTSNVSVLDAYTIDLSSSSGLTGTVAPLPGDDLDGGVGTEGLPPNCAYLVKLGGVSARGVRNGRMYLPGVRRDEVSNIGDITPVTVDAVQAAVSAFLSDILANAGGPLVIVHNPSGGSVSTTEVLGGQVESTIATQRRRLKR